MKFTAVVLIADNYPDSMGDSVTIDEVSFEDSVPVRVEYDVARPVGTVRLSKEGNNVMGDFEISDDVLSEFRGFVGYTPAIGGRVEKSISVQHGNALCGLKITEVALSNRGNSDNRIQQLKGEWGK